MNKISNTVSVMPSNVDVIVSTPMFLHVFAGTDGKFYTQDEDGEFYTGPFDEYGSAFCDALLQEQAIANDADALFYTSRM